MWNERRDEGDVSSILTVWIWILMRKKANRREGRVWERDCEG
jgi:hypothetical protein